MDRSPRPTPQRRASHIEYVHGRAAKVAVREIQEHLGKWQRIAATLRAASVLGHGDAADAQVKASRIADLLAADRAALDARLRDLAPGVATHSLPRDVHRAIDQLETDLRSLLGN